MQTSQLNPSDFIGAKRTASQGLARLGPSSADSFFLLSEPQVIHHSRRNLSSNIPISKHNAQDAFAKLQNCHSVNGICLEDLEAFEAQLTEVKNVKSSLSFIKSDSMPILKATVLGSRSASSLTKHPKNFNITQPRLSLSCSSNMSKREASSLLESSEERPPCPHEFPETAFDRNAIRLSKVHTLRRLVFCLSFHIMDTGNTDFSTICGTCRSPMDFL